MSSHGTSNGLEETPPTGRKRTVVVTAGETLCRGAETIPFPVSVTMMRVALMEGWEEDETGPCCAVKGDVGACEFRWRRGYPD